MSGYKTFAIAGAGNIGRPLIEQFLKAKAEGVVDEVVVLSRDPDSATKFDGARTIAVDYGDKASLVAALAGVDVVISTIAELILPVQLALAAAAKEAGAQLFVPSEFGGDKDGATEGPFLAKVDHRKQIRAVGPPTAVFYSGGWSDFFWKPSLGLDIVNGKITVAGDGNTKLSWTSRADTVRFVVHILTKLPAAKLRDAIFRCEADRKSFVEIAELYEQKTGKKVNVERIPIDELHKKWKANPGGGIVDYWKIALAKGLGLVGEPDNDLFPDWNPAPAIDSVPVA
ncbi:NAD-P-binding protein [Gloeopeniophorella convolvens]|nr:NAD-P-binding protein [Gloeopeniophorella convolvens]